MLNNHGFLFNSHLFNPFLINKLIMIVYIYSYSYIVYIYIRLSEKCLSFTDTSFITMHLYTNMKPKLVIFILIEQNG